jgi:hypothetical protein
LADFQDKLKTKTLDSSQKASLNFKAAENTKKHRIKLYIHFNSAFSHFQRSVLKRNEPHKGGIGNFWKNKARVFDPTPSLFITVKLYFRLAAPALSPLSGLKFSAKYLMLKVGMRS